MPSRTLFVLPAEYPCRIAALPASLSIGIMATMAAVPSRLRSPEREISLELQHETMEKVTYSIVIEITDAVSFVRSRRKFENVLPLFI
jgi:hypothetical protein